MSKKEKSLFSETGEPICFLNDATLKVDGGGQPSAYGQKITKNHNALSFRKTGHPTKAEEGQGWEETDVSDTLNIFDSTELRTPILIVEVKEMKEVYEIGNGQTCNTDLHQVSGSLDCMHDQKAVLIGGGEEMSENRMIVRRLTPKEAERLQGFPDDWTDIGEWTDSKGKKHQSTDGNRYRALGNSLALPFWDWLAEGISDELKRSGPYALTMASLFDGIGGFPLVFQRHGIKPVWASEIEEFPIAVTKRHFPEEGGDQ